MEAVSCNRVVLVSIVEIACLFRAGHCAVTDHQVSPAVIPDPDCLS